MHDLIQKWIIDVFMKVGIGKEVEAVVFTITNTIHEPWIDRQNDGDGWNSKRQERGMEEKREDGKHVRK